MGDEEKTEDESEGTASGNASVGSAGQGELSDDERQEIEKEREERLDPDNRPDTAEIDNTQRDFDVKHGQFTDHEVDEGAGPYNDPNAEDGEMEA